MMFLLGMSLNTIYGSNMLQELRVFGVLQRLAVAYLIAAGFYALTAPKYYKPPRVSLKAVTDETSIRLLCRIKYEYVGIPFKSRE